MTAYNANMTAIDTVFQQIIAEIRAQLTAVKSGTVANSDKLGGMTLQELLDNIATTTGLTISETRTILDDFIVEMANVPRDVANATQALDNANNSVIATPATIWTALGSFWATQVGSAPETLDTINEIATAIAANQDTLAALTAISAGHVEQSVYDAKVAELEAAISGSVVPAASQAEVDAGLEAAKYVAPLTLKVRLAALKTEIEADVNSAFAALKSTLDAGLVTMQQPLA